MSTEKVDVIYQDDVMMALEKPPGLVVNRAESVKGVSVQDLMEKKLGIQNFDKNIKFGLKDEKLFVLRSGMVHRLDKETSGVMLWAKTPQSMVTLMREFKNRKVIKEYLALVHGSLIPTKGFVRLPIGRSKVYRGRFEVKPFAKESYTEYNVERYYDLWGRKYSLVRLTPKTGRTHQIRVHMKQIGHALVSDSLYLSKKSLSNDLDFCPRLFLHANKISVRHPVSNDLQTFESELPDDLNNCLNQMTENTDV